MAKRDYSSQKLIRRSGLTHTSVVTQKHPRLDPKSLCDSGDIIETYIAFAALYTTQVRTVDPTFKRKRFLR